MFFNKKISPESHCQNIEIWPWSLRVNKPSILIDFVKENWCPESHGQNIEILPGSLRANTLSFFIDFVKGN
jgi:hypothetical protein